MCVFLCVFVPVSLILCVFLSVFRLRVTHGVCVCVLCVVCGQGTMCVFCVSVSIMM